MTDSNAKAYPTTDPYDKHRISGGITKREYFAAMALNGILSNARIAVTKDTSNLAVVIADQLIKELNKEDKTC